MVEQWTDKTDIDKSNPISSDFNLFCYWTLLKRSGKIRVVKEIIHMLLNSVEKVSDENLVYLWKIDCKGKL